MGRSGGDQERIARPQTHLLPREPYPGLPLEQQDPLVLGLIVEDGLRGWAADDALDAHRTSTHQILEDLANRGLGEIRQQVQRDLGHGVRGYWFGDSARIWSG